LPDIETKLDGVSRTFQITLLEDTVNQIYPSGSNESVCQSQSIVLSYNGLPI